MCVSPGVVMEEVTRLVSTGDTVKIWDAVSMAPLDQFNPHSISHPVAQACWSSNSILVGGWFSVWVEGFLKPKVFFGRPAVKNLKIGLFSLLSNKKNKFSPLRSCLLGILALKKWHKWLSNYQNSFCLFVFSVCDCGEICVHLDIYCSTAQLFQINRMFWEPVWIPKGQKIAHKMTTWTSCEAKYIYSKSV